MIYDAFPQYWVNHLGFQLRKQLESSFAGHGYRVTAEEWSLLLILHRCDTLSPRDLSRLTLRDPTTVSRLIDRLERRDLVARIRVRKDRRVVDLKMTDAGRGLFADLFEIASGIIEISLKGISAPDIEQTIRVLQKMSDNLAASERKEDV